MSSLKDGKYPLMEVRWSLYLEVKSLIDTEEAEIALMEAGNLPGFPFCVERRFFSIAEGV